MPVHHRSVPHTDDHPHRHPHDTTATTTTTTRPVPYLSPRRVMALLIGVAVVGWAVVAVVVGGEASSSPRSPQPATATDPAPATSQVGDGTDAGPLETVAPSGTAAVEPEVTPEPQPETVPLPEAQPEPVPDPALPAGPDQLAPLPQPAPCSQSCIAPVELAPIEVPVPVQPGGAAFAAAETGCSTECITSAQAWVWPGTSDIEVEVTTHTPAFIKIYVDTKAPGTKPDGRPYIPGSPMAATTGDLDLGFSATLAGLDEDTKYWVLIVATDEDVRSSYAIGTVATPQSLDDVELAFAGIDVIYDGDKGSNKGELTFDWNVGDFEVGRNGEYHRGDGSRIDLAAQVNSYGRFDLGDGELPALQVRGLENDPGIGLCHNGGESGGYGTDDKCGYAWNSTVAATFNLDDIDAMADCEAFDIDERYDGWQCTRITTSESHGGIPEFSVVVAFRLF